MQVTSSATLKTSFNHFFAFKVPQTKNHPLLFVVNTSGTYKSVFNTRA
jgi:hypothetical protein